MHTDVTTIVVSGGIGSGKSFVCSVMAARGLGVYDCDSRVKALYAVHPELSAMLCPDIFDSPGKLEKLERVLFPVLKDDFEKWAEGRKWVVLESATVLDKAYFDGFGDYVVWVEAPQEVRLERAVARGTVGIESILKRMRLQPGHLNDPRVTTVIDSSVSKPEVEKQVDEFLKNINYGKN